MSRLAKGIGRFGVTMFESIGVSQRKIGCFGTGAGMAGGIR
jgi:hypothetical protein